MNKFYQYYEALQVPVGASREEIKQAFHDLITIWHPDKHATNERLKLKAEIKTKELICAYETLVQHLAAQSRAAKPSLVQEKSPPLRPRYEQSFNQNEWSNRRYHPPMRSSPGAALMSFLSDLTLAFRDLWRRGRP